VIAGRQNERSSDRAKQSSDARSARGERVKPVIADDDDELSVSTLKRIRAVS
jgi:hypothetical protein